MAAWIQHSYSGDRECLRFSKRAQRFARAIGGCPQARNLERLPFLAILKGHFGNIRGLTIVDMLCGTGYLAGAVSPFGKVIGIDLSIEMLSEVGNQMVFYKIYQIDAQRPLILLEERPVDAIVHLGGLHHLYIYDQKTGEILFKESVDSQVETLLTWSQLLSPDGIMIIADVAESNSLSVDEGSANIKINLEDSIFRPYEPLLEILGGPSSWVSLNTLKGYVTWHAWKNLEKVHNGSPETFFKKIVNYHCTAGHDAVFINVPLICKALAVNLDVSACIVPTPWIFTSAREAAWFINELFSLGPEIQSANLSSDLSDSYVRGFIDEKIRPFLGITNLSDGSLAVWWELAFLVIKKRR